MHNGERGCLLGKVCRKLLPSEPIFSWIATRPIPSFPQITPIHTAGNPCLAHEGSKQNGPLKVWH